MEAILRLVTWNCCMALSRKWQAMLRLRPDVAIISECAAPTDRAEFAELGISGDPVWIGDNPHKGLAVFAFNAYAVELGRPYHPTLRHVAPVHITGPVACNLLAVWAQNGSGGITRKHQLGPLRRALGKYRDFLTEKASIVAGDFNNNVVWHRPGWRINHASAVAALEKLGLTSAYHALSGERQGKESVPTLYWRDRKKAGPSYHIDYIFVPIHWLTRVRELSVGTFEDWCGSGLSDHVPMLLELDPATSDRLQADFSAGAVP
jgi:exodeoxyribonuclease III